MLYRFQIELSDIDRGLYETLDFRLAQHPSEIESFLLTRALAYALCFQEDLEFSPLGLGDPDAPALLAKGQHGAITLWIEIGNASVRKLHKALKTADRVVVFTYKNAHVLMDEIKSNDVHRAQDLEIYEVNSDFLSQLQKLLEKNNSWNLVHQQGHVDLSVGSVTLSTDILRFSVST